MTTLCPPTAPALFTAAPPRSQEPRKWFRFRSGSEISCQVLAAQVDPVPFPAKVRNLSLTGASLVVGRPLEPGTIVDLRLAHANRAVDFVLGFRIVYTMRRADGHFIVGGVFRRRLTAPEVQGLLPNRLRGLEIEQDGDTIVARYLYYSLLDEEMNRLIDEQLASLVEMLGKRCFILNCSQLEGLTSAMVTQLIAFKKRVAAAAGRLVLCAVPPGIHALLTSMHLDRAIAIYPTEQEALQALRDPDALRNP
jgi:anti-sigma B factor antagonist